jgi:hypothetical protein
MASDEEEYVIDNAHFHNDGIFSFGESFFDTGFRDGGGLFVHRRHRGNGECFCLYLFSMSYHGYQSNNPSDGPEMRPLRRRQQPTLFS